MATVDKKIADEIVAGKYAEDMPVKIVKYDNAWGGESYGVIFAGEPLDRYAQSPYVMNPTVYWEKVQ
jgi:hypothetical protein